MKQDTGKVFDELASGYAAFRPQWNASIIDAVASVSGGYGLALDVGCGSGQATVLLAKHFNTVLATDPAPNAIKQAPNIANVQWSVGSCDAMPAADGSAHLIAAAQAAHWFDMAAFATECRRVAAPGCRVALFGYDLFTVDPRIDSLVADFYADILRDWDERRAFVDARYATLSFPFAEVEPPPMPQMKATWSVEALLGYLRTWSGVRNRITRTGEDPVATVESTIRGHWGDGEREISWPTFVRVGDVS